MVTTPSTNAVRGVIERHGWNATAMQILNPGIERWHDTARDAAVGFVRARPRPTRPRSVWVAAGEPICAPDRVMETARAFEQHAANQGARVCWFGTDRRLRETREHDATLSELVLGAQPVWHPERWLRILAGKASLRQQVNRARNKHVEVTEPSAETAAASDGLHRCLNEWLSRRGLPPLHFLVEPFLLDYLPGRRLLAASRRGAEVGYLILTPVPARSGWLVEQIVQGHDAPNGTAALLIDAAFRAAMDAGSTYFTLGLSPLSERAPPSHPAPPPHIRALLAWMRAHARRFYNFGGLERFKAKFQPDRWDPIVALSQEAQPSLGTLYAIADAFAGPLSPERLIATALGRAVAAEVRGGIHTARMALSS